MKILSLFWSGMSLHDELIQQVKSGMAHKGLSQTELSKLTGVSQGNLSRILRGQRPGTTLDTWDRLLRAVGKR